MKQRQPFISIIVPTYNRPGQLKGCLASISRLDYSRDSFEVIVVDDGGQVSLDGVVAPFGKQVDLTLLTQTHGGPGRARNHGVTKAKGTFLAFTDDDCAPDNGWLKTLSARFAETPDYAIVGRTLNGLLDNPYSASSQAITDFVYAYYNADPSWARFSASNNLAMPAELFKAIGGFDADWPLAAAEDRDLCDRWLHYGYRMIYAPEVIVYHLHSLTLLSFWQQYFNYGRGAFRFHQRRTQRGTGSGVPELQFYLRLLRYSFLKRCRPRILALLMVWQMANAAGFFSEWLRSWRKPEKQSSNY